MNTIFYQDISTDIDDLTQYFHSDQVMVSISIVWLEPNTTTWYRSFKMLRTLINLELIPQPHGLIEITYDPHMPIVRPALFEHRLGPMIELTYYQNP